MRLEKYQRQEYYGQESDCSTDCSISTSSLSRVNSQKINSEHFTLNTGFIQKMDKHGQIKNMWWSADKRQLNLKFNIVYVETACGLEQMQCSFDIAAEDGTRFLNSKFDISEMSVDGEELLIHWPGSKKSFLRLTFAEDSSDPLGLNMMILVESMKSLPIYRPKTVSSLKSVLKTGVKTGTSKHVTFGMPTADFLVANTRKY